MMSTNQENKRFGSSDGSMKHTSGIVREALFHSKYSIIAVVAFMLAGSAVMLVRPLFFKMLFDTAIPEKDTELLWWLLAAMVATPLVAIGVSYYQGHLRVRIGTSVALTLRKAV